MREWLFLISAAMSSCASPATNSSNAALPDELSLSINGHRVAYSGHSGLGCQDAVVISGAPDVSTCVEAQYAWLAQKFRRYETVMHVSLDDGRSLSGLTINTDKGELSVCFDISDCGSEF